VDEQLKRRLIGAIVLVSLAIIFLPMLLEHEPATVAPEPAPMKPIPQEPERNFDSSLLQDLPPAVAPVVSAAPEPEKRTTAAPPSSSPPSQRPQPKKEAPSATLSRTTAEPAPKRATGKPDPAPARSQPKKSAAPASTPRGWVVQVASLTNRENAMKLVRKLRKAGLDTMDPRPVWVKGKRFYRVQVGPEVAKKNAQRHQSLIKRIAGTSGRVMRYP
jgi:DedD protein